jgi:hypothetical protein
MQKKLFSYPKAQDYLPPPDGNNATYGKAEVLPIVKTKNRVVFGA